MTEELVKQQIQALEEEIQVLEDQLDSPGPQSDETTVKPSDVTVFKDRPGYQGYLSLQKQLDLTKAITGVNITGIQRISSDSLDIIKGSLGVVDFTIKYKVLPSQDDDNVPRLHDLKVSIRQKLPAHILEFIQKCEQTSNLLALFQGLSAYVKWCDHREKAFSHYRHKYPQLVEVRPTDQGQVLQVTAHNAMYCVCWSHMISDQLTILPLIQLYIDTKATGPAQDSLPEHFHRLLSKHGMETAIETLLECIV